MKWDLQAVFFSPFRFSISAFASHFHLGEIRACAYVFTCMRMHASLCVCACVRPKLIISAGAERKEQIKGLSCRRGPVETYCNGAAGGKQSPSALRSVRRWGQVGTATGTINTFHSSFSISTVILNPGTARRARFHSACADASFLGVLTRGDNV